MPQTTFRDERDRVVSGPSFEAIGESIRGRRGAPGSRWFGEGRIGRIECTTRREVSMTQVMRAGSRFPRLFVRTIPRSVSAPPNTSRRWNGRHTTGAFFLRPCAVEE